jgi:periplasmic divalent cation tolerance protein
VTVLLCLTACPDHDTARRIAEALVAERLAACVQLLPGATSVYRWQGVVERASEVLLLAKTTRDRFDALSARIVAGHPHAVPEIVAFDVAAGLPAYLDWVARETAPGDGT